MKIAVLTDGIHPYVVGGIQKHSYYFCKHLIEGGHSILLVHTAGTGERYQAESLDVFNEDEKAHIQAVYLPFPGPWRFPLHYLAESYFFSRSITRHCLSLLQECDFVYAQGLTGWDLIRQKKRPPVVVSLQGLNMYQRTFRWRERIQYALLRPAFGWVARNADAVQSVGGQLTALHRQIGVSDEAIFEAGMGIDRSWISYDAAKGSNWPRKMVFIGRYEKLKGIDELSAALKQLNARNIDFEMHFIGPIPEDQKLAGTKYIYHGLVRNADFIRQLLCESDILVCPSYSEGMPSVILEAMASGCAVVATRVGAVEEQVDSDTGWLIPAGNVVALENALKGALAMPTDMLEQMKYNAVVKVEKHFCWDYVINLTFSQIVNTLRKKSLL
jgi:glycosyltransferase involved in cell wall biosynthesis